MSIISESVRSFYNYTSQAAVNFAPELLSTAIQAGFQDSRIGKIIFGASLMLTGVYAMAKCGHPSKSFRAGDQKPIKLAGLGALLFGVGVYFVGSGIAEIWIPKSDLDLFRDRIVTRIQNCTQGHQESDPDIIEKFRCENANKAFPILESIQESDQLPMQMTLERFKQCPLAAANWEKLNQEEKVYLLGVPRSIARSGLALCDLNTILVNVNQHPDGRLHWLSFESQNIAQRNLSMNVMAETHAGNLNRDDFIQSIEKIEFTTARNTYRVNKHCLEKGYWKTAYPEYFLVDADYDKTTFSSWWNSMKNIKTPANKKEEDFLKHSQQAIGGQWDAFCKDAYCAKHPNDDSCIS